MNDEGSLRTGEALDVARVDGWLKGHLPHVQGSPTVTQYRGGASNWTYRLRYDNADLILRRPPAGRKARSAHDMGREYRVQAALRPHFPLVPRVLALCEDESLIGAEFYVMERIEGTILRRSLPAGMSLSAEEARRLCHSALETLVALHRVDVEAAGLATLGKGAGYVTRQIEGWSERYRRARTWNVPRAEGVMRWLMAHLPATERITMTHNDFRFDNLVLNPADPTQIVGVLDWELATLGDPLMDLGNALAYWVQADDDWLMRRIRRQPTHLPGMLTRRELMEAYVTRTGIAPDDWRFYELYGLFRLAGIVQQLYLRYHRRQTRNPAFRHYWLLTSYLIWRCHRLMRRAA